MNARMHGFECGASGTLGLAEIPTDRLIVHSGLTAIEHGRTDRAL